MLVRLLKASDGSHLQTWRRSLADERATAVTSGDGAIFVTGWTTLSVGIGDAPDTIDEYPNYITTRYEQGNLFPIWSDIYEGAPGLDDIAYSIAYSDYIVGETHHYAVYVGGASWQDADHDFDYKLLRYRATDGNQDWDFSDVAVGAHDGNDHLADECFDIGVDLDGVPYATGWSIQTHNSLDAFDFATMRFGRDNGNRGDSGVFDPVLFDGTAHGDDGANAIDVWLWEAEDFPDVWAGGERTDTNEGLNIGTVKYVHH
jgi:hypothetical protein